MVKYIDADPQESKSAFFKNSDSLKDKTNHDDSLMFSDTQNHVKQSASPSIIISANIVPRKLKQIIDKAYDERFYAFPDDVDYDLDLWDSIGTARMNVHTFGYDTYSTDRAFYPFFK